MFSSLNPNRLYDPQELLREYLKKKAEEEQKKSAEEAAKSLVEKVEGESSIKSITPVQLSEVQKEITIAKELSLYEKVLHEKNATPNADKKVDSLEEKEETAKDIKPEKGETHGIAEKSSIQKMIDKLEKEKERLMKEKANLSKELAKLNATGETSNKNHTVPRSIDDSVDEKVQDIVQLKIAEAPESVEENSKVIEIGMESIKGDIDSRELAGLVDIPVHINESLPKESKQAMLINKIRQVDEAIMGIEDQISVLREEAFSQNMDKLGAFFDSKS